MTLDLANETALDIVEHDVGVPVSVRGRQRFRAARKRVHANDNIRLADWIMNRPQIWEEAVTQVVDLLENKARPGGIAMAMEAQHFCMR